MKRELYYVTTNPGKFAEVSRFLQRNAPEIVLKPCSIDIEEIQSLDQQAIAIDKAKKAWALVQKPLLIDDAAIYFDAYNKFPGTLSKFVSQGLGFEGIKRLVDPGAQAHFLLYMTYVQAPDELHVFEGMCKGTLIKPDVFSGHPHLPFDVFFVPEGATITYAAMYEQFDRYADFFYRIKALQAFLTWYKHK